MLVSGEHKNPRTTQPISGFSALPDCTRKEIRPSETKYLLVENKMADVPSKVVVENFSRSSSVKSASVTLYLLWIYFEENRRRLGWNQNG